MNTLKAVNVVSYGSMVLQLLWYYPVIFNLHGPALSCNRVVGVIVLIGGLRS
jgi:hypothetical protein